MVELERYREVSQKAKVGELIRVSVGGEKYYNYGDVGIVIRTDKSDVLVNFNVHSAHVYGDGLWWIEDTKYVVLEPIADSTPSIESRVQELERRLSLVEAKVEPVRVTVSSDSIITNYGLSLMADILSGKTDASTIKPGTGFVPLSRDDVIAMAKRNVDDLLTKHPTIHFRVNRAHGAVVATYTMYGKKIGVGHAKLADGDCFNLTLGKAISALRALGLVVPDCYTNAPQPDGVQVGDVVKFNSSGTVYRITKAKHPYYSFLNIKKNLPCPDVYYPDGIDHLCTIIDDSRE